MMKMKLRINKRKGLLAMLAAVTGLVMAFGHGCSKASHSGGKSSSSSSGSPADDTGNDGDSSSSSSSTSLPDDFIPISGVRTVSTVYAKQVLDNMVSCSGSGNPSAQTLA